MKKLFKIKGKKVKEKEVVDWEQMYMDLLDILVSSNDEAEPELEIYDMKDKIIGASLIRINKDEIVIEKDGKIYHLEIDDDYGDCCGYNDISTKLLMTDEKKPVITSIEKTSKTTWSSGNSCLITFFGEYKPIAEVKTYSYSGSGWDYGACVTVKCALLNIEEKLSQW